MVELTELERDAIGELVNIGVGRAASSLADIVGSEVRLSVPSVSFLSRKGIVRFIEDNGVSEIVAVKQRFEGDFWGDAVLLFPCEKSLELVRSVVGEEVADSELSDLERDALLEVGNIILNACLGSFSNLLQNEINCSLPEYLQGSSSSVLEERMHEEDAVLLLHIDFTVSQLEISGYLVFILDIPAVQAFQKQIDAFVGGIG